MNLRELKHRLLPKQYFSPAAMASTNDRDRSILFVDQSGELGGAEFALLPLAAACSSRSEVVLLSDGPFRARLEERGVSVRVLSNARVSKIDREALRFAWLYAAPGIIGQIWAIAQVARRYDVLFLNTQKALVLGALGKPFHRRQVVWYLHDIMSPAHFGRAQLMIVKWLARHAADRIVVNSQASAQALMALTGLPAAAMSVVHNGIDAAAFMQVDAHDIPALRRRLGLPQRHGSRGCSDDSRHGKASTLRSMRWRSCLTCIWFWWAGRSSEKTPMRRVCAIRHNGLALPSA